MIKSSYYGMVCSHSHVLSINSFWIQIFFNLPFELNYLIQRKMNIIYESRFNTARVTHMLCLSLFELDHCRRVTHKKELFWSHMPWRIA